MASADESPRLGTDRRSRFCQPVTALYFIGLIPRNGKLRGRDRAPKSAQTGHGDRASADQNAEKPANSGPFSSVSGNVKNNRLGGGADRDRTGCPPRSLSNEPLRFQERQIFEQRRSRFFSRSPTLRRDLELN